MNPRINGEVSQGAGSPEQSTGLGKGQRGKRHCWQKNQEQPDLVSSQFTCLLQAQVGSSEMCVCNRSPKQVRTLWAVRMGALPEEGGGWKCLRTQYFHYLPWWTHRYTCVCLPESGWFISTHEHVSWLCARGPGSCVTLDCECARHLEVLSTSPTRRGLDFRASMRRPKGGVSDCGGASLCERCGGRCLTLLSPGQVLLTVVVLFWLWLIPFPVPLLVLQLLLQPVLQAQLVLWQPVQVSCGEKHGTQLRNLGVLAIPGCGAHLQPAPCEQWVMLNP